MNDPRQLHGNHTWDIIVDYYRCPKCGFIIENREKFENRLGKIQKDFTCPRCEHHFLVTKKKQATFGPLWGDHQD